MSVGFRFPSAEWCQDAIRRAEADPESGAASDGLSVSICCVMTREKPVLPEGFGGESLLLDDVSKKVRLS